MYLGVPIARVDNIVSKYKVCVCVYVSLMLHLQPVLY